MPRIRKKTSKRGTTQKRERIKHKATEQRKKNKKAAKNNVQWKSKNPKDPGIPNNFPFKDEILAQVAEERRKVEEEKARRKEAKKASKAAAKNTPSVETASDEGNITDSGLDGVTRISARTSSAPTAKAKKAEPTTGDDEDAPTLLNPDLPHLQAVLDQADVVIELLDARNPLPHRCVHLEEAVSSKAGRKALLVLNKIDTCPREAASSWAARLREHHPTILFRSASAFLPHDTPANLKGKGKEPADDALGASSVLSCLGAWAAEKADNAPLTVAVTGVTNSGKSAFVNSLARRAAIPVYKLPSLSAPSHGPTTTEHPHEVVLEVGGRTIRFIDTPGLTVAPASDADVESTRARDILLRSKGRIDRLKDPLPPVAEIVARANTEDLMLFYNLPAFAKGDRDAFLAALARANGLVKKVRRGGVLELANAARLVLRDWSTGKFPRYTMPPAPSSAHTTSAIAEDEVFKAAYAKDEAILASLPTRKELRKGAGVVRMTPGEVETRKVILNEPWVRVYGGEESDDDEEDEVDEVEEEESDEEDLDEDEGNHQEDQDEEESDGEAVAPAPTGKRKRQEKAAPGRTPKKVAFAASATEPVKFAKAGAPSKSALKKTSTPSVKAKVAALKQMKASVPSKKTTAGKGKDGEELYDFTKFF